MDTTITQPRSGPLWLLAYTLLGLLATACGGGRSGSSATPTLISQPTPDRTVDAVVRGLVTLPPLGTFVPGTPGAVAPTPLGGSPNQLATPLGGSPSQFSAPAIVATPHLAPVIATAVPAPVVTAAVAPSLASPTLAATRPPATLAPTAALVPTAAPVIPTRVIAATVAPEPTRVVAPPTAVPVPTRAVAPAVVPTAARPAPTAVRPPAPPALPTFGRGGTN